LSSVSGRAFGGIGAVGGGIGAVDGGVNFGGGVRVFSGGGACQVWGGVLMRDDLRATRSAPCRQTLRQGYRLFASWRLLRPERSLAQR